MSTAVGQGALTGAATGAAVGAPFGPVGAGIGAGVGALAGGAIGYFGSSEERKIRDAMEADTKRMANGGGGMSQGKLQAMQASGMGQINAQQQQALAQMARGSAMGGGESGMRAMQQGQVYQGAMQAGQQMQSKIREQDLLYAQQQRALNKQLQMAWANKDDERTKEMYAQMERLAMTPTDPMQLYGAKVKGGDQRLEDAAKLKNVWSTPEE